MIVQRPLFQAGEVRLYGHVHDGYRLRRQQYRREILASAVECRLCDTDVRFDSRQYIVSTFLGSDPKAWLVTTAKTEFFNNFLLADSRSNLRDCLAKTFWVLLTKNDWCQKD